MNRKNFIFMALLSVILTLGLSIVTYNVSSIILSGVPLQTTNTTVTHELGYSSFIGGIGSESDLIVHQDSLGNIYVAGSTHAGQYVFPSQADFGLPITEQTDTGIFVVKFYPNMDGVAYEFWISGNANDNVRDMVSDNEGNLYLIGLTQSDTLGYFGYDTTYGGNTDALIMKIGPTGALLNATYLGGVDGEWGNSIAINPSGQLVLTGITCSTLFPTKDAFQDTLGGSCDGFLTIMDRKLSELHTSTYLGGMVNDYAHEVLVDDTGNIYVSGTTDSDDFPLVNEVLSHSVGTDIFLAKFNATATGILISTMIEETLYSLTLDYIPVHMDLLTTNDIVVITHNGSEIPIIKKLDKTTLETDHQYDFDLTNFLQIQDVKIDNNNNIIAIGYAASSLSGLSTSDLYPFNSEGSRVGYLFEFDIDLNFQDAIRWGLSQTTPSSLFLTADHQIYIVGDTSSDVWPLLDAYDIQSDFFATDEGFIIKINQLTSPEAPQNVRASVDQDSGYALITWETPLFDGNSEIRHYTIERSANEGEFLEIDISKTLLYIDHDIQVGNNYTYRVQAVNDVGSSTSASSLQVSYSGIAVIESTTTITEQEDVVTITETSDGGFLSARFPVLLVAISGIAYHCLIVRRKKY